MRLGRDHLPRHDGSADGCHRGIDDPRRHRDSRLRDDGDVDKALANGRVSTVPAVLKAEYRVPFLAHATMEPMNAVAWLHDGKLEIWAGVQNPTASARPGGQGGGP